MKRHNPKRRPRRTPSFTPRELVITPHGTSHDGRAIGKMDGKTVFIAGALAGETVRARLTAEQSRFAEARTLEVIESAPERVSPQCKHFGVCGGCQLQFMSLEHQLVVKQQAVVDQLRRAQVEAPAELAQPLTGSDYGYRARARLAVKFDRLGEVTLGFRQFRDKQLVDLHQCPILKPELERLIAPLRRWLQEHQLQAVTHIDLACDDEGATCVLRHLRPLPEVALSDLAEWAQTHEVRVWLQGDKDPHLLRDIHGLRVDPRLSFALPETRLSLAHHPSDFTQVNPVINRQMIAQALDWLALEPGQVAVDCFCGIGNFTLPLAACGVRAIGLEAVESMVVRGRENAAANGLENAEFIARDLTQISLKQLLSQTGSVDAFLLDPPRAGAPQVCEQLAETDLTRVLYVSCNPATLARDAKQLVDGGFALTRLGVMEMFPQTSHIETMALFERR